MALSIPKLQRWGASTMGLSKFGNGREIPSHIILGMWLLIHAGIEVNLCQ